MKTKASAIISAILIMILLGSLAYVLYERLPGELKEFKDYQANISKDFPTTSNQFYENMRYPDRKITYSISDSCTKAKEESFKQAVDILEKETVLEFFDSSDGEIKISCSNITPTSQEKGHFILGEGGPSKIFDLATYSVIIEGKIALYREEKCEKPIVALHELLHALGFDHNSNPESILYPLADCDQELDIEIIETINELYKQDSLGDLNIEKVSATKSGPYLNFEITISNEGLRKTDKFMLKVKTKSKEIKEFEMDELDIGDKIISTVTNLNIPRSSESITFEVYVSEEEISKENNVVTLELEG